MKTCKQCQVLKPLVDYPKAPRMRDGHENLCTGCKVEYNKQRISKMIKKPISHKTCIDCSQTKTAAEFYKSSYYKDGLDCRCNDCGDAKTYAWRAKNPDKYNEGMRTFTASLPAYEKYLSEIKRRYNCTQEMYETTLKRQDNKCAIASCGYVHTPSKFKGGLCVDHNHVTKEIRGLLCERRNKGLGHFRDNIDIMKDAVLYLNKKAG